MCYRQAAFSSVHFSMRVCDSLLTYINLKLTLSNIYKYVHMYTCKPKYKCIHTYIYVYVYLYIYTYIYMYTMTI